MVTLVDYTGWNFVSNILNRF